MSNSAINGIYDTLTNLIPYTLQKFGLTEIAEIAESLNSKVFGPAVILLDSYPTVSNDKEMEQLQENIRQAQQQVEQQEAAKLLSSHSSIPPHVCG